jgi:hypothetical protein
MSAQVDLRALTMRIAQEKLDALLARANNSRKRSSRSRRSAGRLSSAFTVTSSPRLAMRSIPKT